MTKKEKAKDYYLRRKYNITLSEYNEKLKHQGGVCAVCGRPPKNLALAVDHNHKVEKAKIHLVKQTDEWVATEPISGFMAKDKSRGKAKQACHKLLKRKSVRGLLCFICNKKVLGILERFKIKPSCVIQYLKDHDPQNEIIQVITLKWTSLKPDPELPTPIETIKSLEDTNGKQ